MNRSSIDIIEGLIVISFCVLVLVSPDWFKKGLKADPSGRQAKRLRAAGWIGIIGGALLMLAGIVSALLHS